AGAAAFYAAWPAQALARAVREAGGVLAAEDLAGYEAAWVTPLETSYCDHAVRALPPNSYGPCLLLQLGALGDAGEPDEDYFAVARFRRLMQAAAAAFAVADRDIADPAAVPAFDLPQRLAQARDVAARGAGHFVPNTGGTAALVVADRDGNAVSWLQSVMGRFGSMVADPVTGIVLNNRMRGFVADPLHPNAIGPRKKPAHSLCPAMAFDGGGLRYVLATPGGPGQTVTLAQAIDALVRLRLPPANAIGAARWAVDRTRQPVIERSAPPALIEALKADGVSLGVEPAGSPFFGTIACIERLPSGTLLGIGDHRRETDLLGR
ncbi:MAG: gamma-glutamyltransferase, partial [Rhodospirillaceae bacterium]|nr:gamma-glutamyltransferase [Rhodospirillaceae bacterium]